MVHDEWRWIADGLQTAEENMAVDAALLAACEQGRIPPTVRLYGWSEPAITIGYSQKAEAELDVERCRELGIAVVRRPTGGRALLHFNELTYAVVAPVTRAPFNRGLKATFEAISEALLSGLKGLGVQGNLNTRRQRPALATTSPLTMLGSIELPVSQ
jgi:lipoate-protein ligase A